MNRRTGATAIVPGSHLKVDQINEELKRLNGGLMTFQHNLERASSVQPFTAHGLAPVITNVRAGDCVLFDTRTFHGGYSAEDPTGESGREPGNLGKNNLLRAIYILGASPTALQTPEILTARRLAYELDIFWPPPLKHHKIARKILAGDALPDWLGPLPDRQAPNGQKYPTVRRFEDAPAEVKRLIDP